MNTPTDNSNNYGERYDIRASIASLVRPLRIEIAHTAHGWKIDISSLTPSDAVTALERDDLLVESTILCSTSSPQWVARLDGSIDEGVANNIVHEVSAMHSPLCADRRMHSLVMSRGDGICAHVRNYEDALLLGVSAIARYLSDILGEPVSLPELVHMDILLARTGCISIRPVDIGIYSTFVDVGIATMNSTGSSDMSLIYDIHSDTWHGD